MHHPSKNQGFSTLTWAIAIGVIVAGGLAGWLLAQRFGGRPERLPVSPERYLAAQPELAAVPPEQLDAVAAAVVQPQAMSGEEKQGVLQTLGNVTANVKAAVVRVAIRKSLEGLRRNFDGLTTPEQKQAKVREIMDDIERNYVVDDTTAKIFNRDFIATGLVVYLKEVPARDRALYDPIIHQFIQKLNAHKN